MCVYVYILERESQIDDECSMIHLETKISNKIQKRVKRERQCVPSFTTVALFIIYS